jgi:FtsZ-interacting cell division protein YlmF
MKENKINKADEEGGIEADMLTRDGENDNENDRVVEKPTRKGRSRTSMSGQSNMQIKNLGKNKEVKEAETSTKSTISTCLLIHPLVYSDTFSSAL